MRCDECLTLLDQYIEDELDEVTSKSLTAHIASCRECAGAHEAVRREQEIYASYLVDVEPSPHLWVNLRSELENEKAIRESRPPLQRWLAVVLGDWRVTPQFATALVLITIGLGIGILLWRTNTDPSRHQVQNSGSGFQPSPEENRAGPDPAKTDGRSPAGDDERRIVALPAKSGDRRRPRQTSASGRATTGMIERSPAVPTVEQVARGAEQQYLSAIEILSGDIKRRRAFISPALLSQLETALAEVDRNIAATRRAAREQPRDPVAVQYLAIAYEKKVELLREVINQ